MADYRAYVWGKVTTYCPWMMWQWALPAPTHLPHPTPSMPCPCMKGTRFANRGSRAAVWCAPGGAGLYNLGACGGVRKAPRGWEASSTLMVQHVDWAGGAGGDACIAYPWVLPNGSRIVCVWGGPGRCRSS